MPHARRSLLVAVLAVVAGVVPAVAAPLFALSDDGAYFLYRARPGDHPGVVAEMFGIPQEGVSRFLASNGISDATRVDAGFVYRIPNPVAERAASLAAENERLARAADDAQARTTALTRETQQARTAAAGAEARAAELARYEGRWTVARAVIVLLGLVLAAAVAVASAAVRRQQQAERWARSLERDAEERRRGTLAERQESGRRIIELESRVRELEAKLGPRVVIGGRSA
jgi:hypothetical protein